MRVIVTGAGALLGQGVIRSLHWSKLGCHIAGVDPSCRAAGLYWCDVAYEGRPAADPEFLAVLRRIIAAERAVVLIPGTDVELPVLAAERGALEAGTGCTILVSSPEVVRIADDKLETSRFFRDAGFAYPLTASIDDAAGVAEVVAAAGFPLIVKPRVGARSVGVRRIEHASELDAAARGSEAVIVQELIGDDEHEYTASGLYFDGACDAAIVMRRELRDGNTYRAEIDRNPELETWVRRWTAALKPFGPANFQFRRRPDGTPVVFEINARFSGTTPLRARAGFNEVEMALRRIVHGQPVVQSSIQDVVLLRHWSETVVTPDQLSTVQCP
jgi:carbamoyl-phosphate synthase large subunit